MIKRIIACLTICLIITGLISPVFSDASALPQPNWSDPGISEIINISDLTGWMLNGGTFDVSQYTDAESFMNDYFNARTKTRLVSPGEDAEDYYEVLPGFGINNQLVAGDSFARPLDTNRVISSSFRDHTGYGRRLSNAVNDALLSSGSLYDTKIPLLNEVEFANFVGYNHDALRLYSEFFSFESPEQPESDPDPNYQVYIDFINKRSNDGYNCFWFYNYPQYMGNSSNGLGGYTYLFPLYNYSFIVSDLATSGFTTFEVSNPNTPRMVVTDIRDIYINSVGNGQYTFTDNITLQYVNNIGYRYYIPNYSTVDLVGNDYIYISSTGNYDTSHRSYGFNYSGTRQQNFTRSYTGTLTNVFNYLKQYYKNINIYVDNVPWSIVNTPSIPPHITPEFPDAVGGEDLPNTTWPISRPRAPYYTSVPGMLQAIEDAIADDGELDIDDLKPYLTDENGVPVPDPVFDPEPVPVPVPDPVNPDIVPGLPVLPAIPPEMPGFNGVSVLAEIINFTNQSLPTALIVTFWGIVFGIVILGLIKILHK